RRCGEAAARTWREPQRRGAPGAAAPSRGLHQSGPLTVGRRARFTGENQPDGICARRAAAATRELRLHGPGETKDVPVNEELAAPRPGEGELRVRVRAAAVNFPDALLCRGMYQVRPDPPFTPGVELCADVVQAGPGVSGSAPAAGTRIIGGTALPSGAFAEYALVRADAAFPAPDSLDDGEAASLFIGYQTGWFALHRRANLQPGETVLVHAAAGGVGSAAIQLA